MGQGWKVSTTSDIAHHRRWGLQVAHLANGIENRLNRSGLLSRPRSKMDVSKSGPFRDGARSHELQRTP